uniref:Mitochondrial resolvase Ydc2 catalytic domain-containing protein n=1 Tax=viral metagenome TaxID=1070528 RepID=A0A6C0D666_9ZZZZ
MLVICFDIGIKNLAWCCYNSDNKKILGWQNYDLINDGDVADIKEKYKCIESNNHGIVCNKNGVYTFDSKYYCGKHNFKPIFKDLSGNVFKKMPTVSVLKEITKQTGKKEELFDYVRKNYCMPIEKKKAIKKAFDLEALHDSIRKFVLDNKELFYKANHIGLENQPVLKNPVMKTVQVLLYATLRDILQPVVPKMHLIHAGKKIQGKATGEAGYKDRKEASVSETKEFLKKNIQESKFVDMFNNSKKQNDLADSLLMAIELAH